MVLTHLDAKWCLSKASLTPEEFLLSCPVWEIRHGAIIALREILSSHASSAGVTRLPENLNPSAAALEARRANEAWLEDCAVRLLCIFALDRFGDFVSDQVSASHCFSETDE